MVVNNKKPIRQCISCRTQLSREHFVRIVKVNDPSSSSKVILNPNRYQLGRSVYLCKNPSCLELAIKAKKIEKMLKVKSHEITIDRLIGFASLAKEEAA